MGCNLASLFTGIPQFSVHAWFFTIATAVGTYAGVKVTLLPMFRVKLELKKAQQNYKKLTRNKLIVVSGLVWLSFCLSYRFPLCDDKLRQTGFCNALWFSFRLIN